MHPSLSIRDQYHDPSSTPQQPVAPVVATLDLTVIIPCYKDAQHLRRNTAEVVNCLRQTRLSWEIILVNDASPERDLEVAREIVADWPGESIQIIDHPKNTGRGKAVTDGLLVARGRYAGFLDIDLEVGAHYIPAMVSALEKGNDVACALRIYKLHLGLLHRAVMSVGYSFLVHRLLGADLQDTEAGYKFFRMDAIRPILDQCENAGWFWDTEIMVRSKLANLHICYVPVLFLRNSAKISTVRIVHDSVAHFKHLFALKRRLKTKA